MKKWLAWVWCMVAGHNLFVNSTLVGGATRYWDGSFKCLRCKGIFESDWGRQKYRRRK